MELMKEIKKYNKINGELRKAGEAKKEIDNKSWMKRDYIHDQYYVKNNKNIEEIRTEAKRKYGEEPTEEELKELYNNIELLKIESNLIYNNIILLMYNKYNNNVIETLKKYQNKAIGEKTKEKLENDVKEVFTKDFKNYDVFIHYTDSGSWYNEKNELSIEIRDPKAPYQENYKIKYEFEEVKESSYNIKTGKRYYFYIVYNNNDDKYIVYKHEAEAPNIRYNYIENVKAQAKSIIKESNKNKKELEEIKAKAKELAHKNNNILDNNFLKNDICKSYELSYQLNIY